MSGHSSRPRGRKPSKERELSWDRQIREGSPAEPTRLYSSSDAKGHFRYPSPEPQACDHCSRCGRWKSFVGAEWPNISTPVLMYQCRYCLEIQQQSRQSDHARRCPKIPRGYRQYTFEETKAYYTLPDTCKCWRTASKPSSVPSGH